LRKQFSNWYSKKINPTEQSHDNLVLSQSTVDLSLSCLKPLGAQWLTLMFGYFKANKDIIINGYQKAGVKFNH
jgi:hypothetical protein